MIIWNSASYLMFAYYLLGIMYSEMNAVEHTLKAGGHVSDWEKSPLSLNEPHKRTR